MSFLFPLAGNLSLSKPLHTLPKPPFSETIVDLKLYVAAPSCAKVKGQSEFELVMIGSLAKT